MKDKMRRLTTEISKLRLDGKMFFKYEYKNSKFRVLLSLFATILSIIAVVGLSYSLWTKTDSTGDNSISTGIVSMRYVEDINFVSINNAEPMTASEAYQSNNYFPFRVELEAGASMDIPYEVTITTQNGTTYLNDTDSKVRIGLKKDDVIITDAGFTLEGSSTNVNYTNGIVASSLPTSGAPLTNNPQTIYKAVISLSSAGVAVHNFKLYLWVDSDVTLGTAVENYSITVNINTGNS